MPLRRTETGIGSRKCKVPEYLKTATPAGFVFENLGLKRSLSMLPYCYDERVSGFKHTG